jgi:hypothetical protein
MPPSRLRTGFRGWLVCALASIAAASVTTFAACSSFTSDAPAPVDAGSGDAPTDAASPDSPVDSGSTRADGSTGSAYAALVMADSPVAYWRMGAMTGITIHDESGHGNDLVLQGAAGSTTLGAAGAIVGDDDTAVRFDGIDGHARAVNARAFDFQNAVPFTIELWAKREVLDGGHTFQHMLSEVTGSAGQRTGFSLFATPASGITSFEYYAYDGGECSARGALIAAGEWAHYAAVLDASKTLTLYINATAGNPIPIVGPMTLATAQLFIGAESSGDHEFPGVIDEVAIYDKALSITQIAAHVTMGRP